MYLIKIIPICFLVLLSSNVCGNEIVYEYSGNQTGYLTRKAIKEYRVIQAHKNRKKETNTFTTEERISSMKELGTIQENQQQMNNIQIPLIWYSERF